MNNTDLNIFYTIFNKCFPYIPISENIFTKRFLHDSFDTFTEYDNEKLAGFLVLSDNSIILICVEPDKQGMGYGGKLLEKCEKFLREKKYNKAIVGKRNPDFFLGAVINNLSHLFFEKHGYCAYNGCLSMMLKLEKFRYQEIIKKYSCPSDIKFEFCNKDSYKELLNAVITVEPKWMRHYSIAENILIAKQHDRITGFLILGFDEETFISSGKEKIGTLDYIGVVPDARGKGIGTNIAAYGTQLLKEHSCSKAFIKYTSLEEWYKKIGYEDFLWFWFGEKDI